MSFVWKRLLGTVPSLLGVIILTFFISHALPGDPAAFFAGPAANAASIANIRTTLGLDRPLPEQFLHYVNELAHGNLGHSLTTGQPVLTDLVERLPASLELSAFALLFAVELVSLPVFVLFYNLQWGAAQVGPMLLVLVMGTWALTVIGTLFSALTVNLRLRELMLPTLVYPMMIPALIAAMTLTTDLLAGHPLGIGIRFLVAFDIIFTLLAVVFVDTVLVG